VDTTTTLLLTMAGFSNSSGRMLLRAVATVCGQRWRRWNGTWDMGHGTWDLELANYPNWPICSVTSELFYIILMFPKGFRKLKSFFGTKKLFVQISKKCTQKAFFTSPSDRPKKKPSDFQATAKLLR